MFLLCIAHLAYNIGENEKYYIKEKVKLQKIKDSKIKNRVVDKIDEQTKRLKGWYFILLGNGTLLLGVIEQSISQYVSIRICLIVFNK